MLTLQFFPLFSLVRLCYALITDTHKIDFVKRILPSPIQDRLVTLIYGADWVKMTLFVHPGLCRTSPLLGTSTEII